MNTPTFLSTPTSMPSVAFDQHEAPLSITLNGRTVPLRCRTTLAALLAALGQDSAALATAVNGDFVAREERSDCVLNAGDHVTVFGAIVGG